MKKLKILLPFLLLSTGLFAQNSPGDRVRLKGSPRSILTWSGADFKASSGKLTNGDSVFAFVRDGMLVVNHKKNNFSVTLFESLPDQGLSSTYLGLYEYNFDDNPQDMEDRESELVLINSPMLNVSMVKVYHMAQQPPVLIGTMWGNADIEFNPDKLIFTIETVSSRYKYSDKSFKPE